MSRILIGSLAGGVVFFIWGFVSNMVLQLGAAGTAKLPDEDAVLRALSTVTEPALYIIPGMNNPDLDGPEFVSWSEKTRRGPVGVLALNPNGMEPISAGQLGTQLVIGILASLIAAVMLARTAGGYVQRVLSVTSLGLFAWIVVNLSYWNWYQFPPAHAAGQGADTVIGWTLVGLVMAKLVRPADKAAA